MTAREEHDQSRWDGWVSMVRHAQFLQSWAWGDGQAALGKRVRRLVFEENNELVCLAQAYEERRCGLSYWMMAGGPVMIRQNWKHRTWLEVLELLKTELLRGRAVFLRLEPWVELAASNFQLPACLPTASFNPAIHWMVELQGKTEIGLLAAMQQKTRYNIHLGERQGVTTRTSIEERDFEVFLSLTNEMARRNKIAVHGDEYLRSTFFAMVQRSMARLRIADYQGRALAASIEVGFGDTLTYLHGASSSSQREVKAPQVLHWQAMCEALQAGYKWYDFGGCNPADSSHRLYKNSLEGVTRFKEGWGGERVEFAGTFVVPRWRWVMSWI